MPRIPTFESTIAPTAEVGAVKSNIQVSPKDSLAGALVPAANAVTQFYVKEKEISNKVEGGQLIADANQELLEIKEKSKLKSTPEEGVNFFNAGYKQVVDKYKSKANNNYIQKYFELNISSNKPSYVNNILKTTRANMVKTRVSQVSNVVENKILNAVESDNKFDLSTLAESVFNDYQGLVNDGLISEADLQIYRDKLPNLVEVAQVRKIARNNASQAFLILSDVQNFTTIQGDERRKLISEFGTLAKQQADVTSAVLNQSIIEKSKEFMEKYGSKETFGFSTEELEQFKTGDEETDNQIVSLNEKIVNKEFSFDTNYNTNTDVISKIASGEIKNTSTKFLLAGETEAKSILDRAGDKTINNKDVKFLSDVIIRNNNDTLKKQDQQFLKYFENLVPLLQGNTFLNYFDKEYNAKASELRQTLHARYLNGLSQGAEPNDLLSYTSENYIAKDIKNYLPKTSDLGSIIVEMAAENNSTIDGPPRIEGENATEYLKRIENKKNIDVGDENSLDLSASLDTGVKAQFAGLNDNKFNNVNFDFIVNKLEGGTKLKGYDIDPEKFPNSGVTIAGGVDLGARNLNDLKGLPDQLIEKLKPYLGLKGYDAQKKLNEKKLTLSKKEADILNKFIQEDILIELQKDWKEATGESFDKLSMEQATAVASVAFVYGNSKIKTFNFWKYATSNEWEKVKNELMNFKDKSKSINDRHKKAGRLLQGFLNKQENILEV